ncbi:glutathione S-transferase family protein [Herbaspirillum sp. RTI4]|uniref:glutathione S-transferase family protein n=1 Tax=Herbaspirillum sp. RTI4 TaxID=3048640 RepID=UPI002AB44D9E|nr:glutathione S-transferase family protein [Herbaspirillum sp. RTI4]MDY7576821.1 glutathione S-transferase family protein [Herbaspirillum sp. RTI4]MEA9981417.1 glutathione S-transferase family protein [Herbaspirillum sp. RTI4]
MITLYHCLSARSFRPLWMLEELSTPYALKMLPFPPRIMERDYLALNPLGTVPLLVDGDTRMTESAAMCQYLAAKAGSTSLDVAVDEPAFGAYLNFLHFGEATLTFPQTLVLRYGRFEPEARRSPQVAEDYSKWFLSRLRSLEPLLEAQEFLCADRFTAADVSVSYALLLAQHLGLDARFTPAVAAYWQRMRLREGFIRAMSAQKKAAVEQDVSAVHAPDALPPAKL